ncbi:MAG: hypothetical protein OWT27_05260 [Firmicutes bacterium]|nr:hypothetical protein [Bacillota bacterium]
MIDILVRQQDVRDVARFQPDLVKSRQYALAAPRHPGVHEHWLLAEDDIDIAAFHLLKHMHAVGDFHGGRSFGP